MAGAGSVNTGSELDDTKPFLHCQNDRLAEARREAWVPERRTGGPRWERKLLKLLVDIEERGATHLDG